MLFVVLLLFVNTLSSIFAASLDDFIYRGPREAIDIIVDYTTPFFEVLIGDYSGSEFFFAKVWLLILLFIVIHSIVKKIPQFEDNNGVVFIISAVVSVFSIRFMPQDLMEVILMPYTTLGITLTTIIPFLIFFWFVHHTGIVGPGRRLAWGLYAAIFALLTYTRYPSMPDIAKNFYWIALGLIILALVFDRKIHAYFRLWEVKKMEKTVNDKIVLNLLDDLETAERHGETEEGKAQVKRIRKRLRDLGVKNL